MPFDLTLSPSISEYVVKPGHGFTQAFDVVNNSSESIFLIPEIKPFQPEGDTGQVSYPDLPSNNSISFSLNNADLKLGSSFRLDPGAKQQLVLKVKTTNDYRGDGYFTLFLTQDTSATPQTESTANARIGAHLLLSLSENEQTPVDPRLDEFTATPFFKDIFSTPINFTGIVSNTGNYFFKTNGTITISKSGKNLAHLNLFPSNVLAHHSRQIICSSRIQNQESSVPVPCSLNPPFWPGVYTATLTLNGEKPISVSTQFFVFPYYFTLSLAALLVFLFFLNRLFRHR